MVTWAITRRRQPEGRSSALMRAPYRPLRTPSSSAVPTAEKYEPPAPMTLTSANCDAPENKTSESKQTWIRFRCASTATAPNDNPKGVTLTPMVNARLRIRRLGSARRWGQGLIRMVLSGRLGHRRRKRRESVSRTGLPQDSAGNRLRHRVRYRADQDRRATAMSRRAEPPFRADHVGSLLRPAALMEARSQKSAETI